MPNIKLVHELVSAALPEFADREALIHRSSALTYQSLWGLLGQWRSGLLGLGLGAGERVGVYLPKGIHTVAALFGTSAAGGCFVPLNPLLKPAQVAYILSDCNVRILVTSTERANLLVRGTCALPGPPVRGAGRWLAGSSRRAIAPPVRRTHSSPAGRWQQH